MINKLFGKNIIIIGGSGLIGKSITNLLLSRDCNLLNLDKKKLLIKNKKYKYKEFDLKSFSDLEFEKLITSHFKHIDGYVNASYPRNKNWTKNNFEEIDFDNLSDNLIQNAKSYVYQSNLIAKKMIKSKKGSIVLLSSIYGFLGQNINLYKGLNMRENITYSFYKGGLINYVKQMASYYGQYNIRINCISPGGVEGHVAGNFSKIPTKFKQRYIKNVPLNRMAKPKDIANATEFLLSENSSYITGTNLVLDGGYSAI